jgi:peptide/nickel transport system permease protein
MGLALSGSSYLSRSSFFHFAAGLSGDALISTPAAVLALLFVMLRWPPVIAVGLLVFPKIYRYSQNLIQHSADMPHVLAARARGAGRLRLLVWHVAPSAVPQLIALVGVSISIGFGILLPVEVLCDVPGVGQLAWIAAQARDLPLLVNLTLLVSFLTIAANVFTDQVGRMFARGEA